jgi:hypothetical protein
MHGSRSKILSKKSRLYIYDVKFLALLSAPYICDISRLRVKFSCKDTGGGLGVPVRRVPLSKPTVASALPVSSLAATVPVAVTFIS